MKTLEERFPWWWGNGYRPLTLKWWSEWGRFLCKWFGWAFRGDADEWWYLDTSWVAYALPKVRQLRYHPNRMAAYPAALECEVFPDTEPWDTTEDQHQTVCERWNEILEKIIVAFEVYLEDTSCLGDQSLDEIYKGYSLEPPEGFDNWTDAQAACKEGFELWFEWWQAMWD